MVPRARIDGDLVPGARIDGESSRRQMVFTGMLSGGVRKDEGETHESSPAKTIWNGKELVRIVGETDIAD